MKENKKYSNRFQIQNETSYSTYTHTLFTKKVSKKKFTNLKKSKKLHPKQKKKNKTKHPAGDLFSSRPLPTSPHSTSAPSCAATNPRSPGLEASVKGAVEWYFAFGACLAFGCFVRWLFFVRWCFVRCLGVLLLGFFLVLGWFHMQCTCFVWSLHNVCGFKMNRLRVIFLQKTGEDH